MARKKRPVIIKQGAAEWMNTYGDMVTLLLCFFVLLFSMSKIDAAKFQAFISSFDGGVGILDGGPSVSNSQQLGGGVSQMPNVDQFFLETMEGIYSKELEELKEIAEELKEHMEQTGIAQKVDIDYNEMYVRLSFLDGVFFDTGKAALKPEAIDILEAMVEPLKKYEDYRIKIEGHTDNRPIRTAQYPSNWYLSSARAIAVAEYYIHEKDFDPKRISADGFGEYAPIASNETAEGRAQNRRVEMKILNHSLDLKNLDQYLNQSRGEQDGKK
ncbi:MAG: flagellar motor protein MotB [Epulopiscium sp.]|nr:flagellar motor protein MotB [Candidatus Epulonipiscium sp.]